MSTGPQSGPRPWHAFLRTLLRFERDKITPWLALRNTAGVVFPLAAGAVLGQLGAGLAVATGALTVSFSDSHDAYRSRARKMLAASVMVGLAVAAGAASGQIRVLPVVLAGAWAFAAGMLVALSNAAADLGVLSLFTLIVYAARPLPWHEALLAGMFAAAGGALQTGLALAFWPLRRYAAQCRALAELYSGLALAASTPVRASQAPPASLQSTQAQEALSSLDRDHSLHGERFRLLLSQAERIRLVLMMLGRLRVRLSCEPAGLPCAKLLDGGLTLAAPLLQSLASALQPGAAAPVLSHSLSQLQSLADQVRVLAADAPPSLAAMATDARFQLDALAGQLRSAIDLAVSASPEGLLAFDRRESRRPWRLRLSGTFAILRANLSLNSAACRHAIRLAVCVTLGSALGHSLGWHRSYWLPMTVAIVLKPDFTATFSRGVLRLSGTFAGLLLSTALFHLLPSGLASEILLIGAFTFLLRCFGSANYGIFVTAVTAVIVLLVAVTGVSPGDVIAARGLNSAVGGVLALLAFWLWPTRERSRIPDILAAMLDAYRAYFQAIAQSYMESNSPASQPLDQRRLGARRERSNLEASLDRLMAEPGVTAETRHALGGILANSHRLVHAIMALEAGLWSSNPVPARPAFRQFAHHVELTLHSLAAALRGSPLRRSDLPDLREDHRRLVQTGDSLTERYALVNVETDRITNSLNTLVEDLLTWLRETS